MAITRSQLPGPKGLPVIGKALHIDVNDLHNQLAAWADEYGSIYKVRLGTHTLTIVTDPELIHGIYKNRPYTFARMRKLDLVLREGNVHGVFNAEGEDWEAQRKVVAKGLDIEHQRSYFDSMRVTLGKLYNKWKADAETGNEIDIQRDFLRFTVDITSELAFGCPMNTLEEEGSILQDDMEKIFPMIFKRINDPIPWYKLFKTKRDREYDKALGAAWKQVDVFIEKGRKRLAECPELRENPKNFLDNVLVAAEEEDTFNDEEIKSNLITLLFAGEDTTAHSLAWAMVMLTQHPEAEERLRSEADELLKEDPFVQEYLDIQNFKYAEAVSHETMRVKGVAPLNLFEPNEDVELGGYLFEKNQRILVQTRHAAMQDKYFTDGKKFLPDRWLKESNCPVHNTKAHSPFGGGPRYCPGRNLAILEMKLVLSMLYKNFDVEMITSHEDIKEIMAFTMMASDYKVKLSLRK